MDRFKFDVFAAKSAAISSSVVAILSFSANLQITTAGLKDIAGTERGWGDLGIGYTAAQNATLISRHFRGRWSTAGTGVLI